MDNFLSFEKFMALEKYNNPNGRNNLRYFDAKNLLKLTRCNVSYWERIMNKKLNGFNVPSNCFDIDDEVNSVIYSESFKTAVVTKYLVNHQKLSDLTFFGKKQSEILKIIRDIFYNNAVAVSNGFIYVDYNPFNIMIEDDKPIIIDLEMSLVDGHGYFENCKIHNFEYLYGRNHFESDLELINCAKITLLNLLITLLAVGEAPSLDSSRISPLFISKIVSSIGLPEQYERKYIDILEKRNFPDKDDFFIDDMDDLIKNFSFGALVK